MAPLRRTGRLLPIHRIWVCALPALQLHSSRRAYPTCFGTSVCAVTTAQNALPPLTQHCSPTLRLSWPPPAPPAPLGWVQSALTTLSCTHSFPACFLHRTRSQERARISPCSSFLSHQCQVEKMLKSVCLVNCAKRRENVLESHPAPVSSPVEQFLLVMVEDAAGRHSSPQQSQPKTPLEINCTFPNNLRA